MNKINKIVLLGLFVLVSLAFNISHEIPVTTIKKALLKYIVSDTVEYNTIDYVNVKDNYFELINDTALTRLYPETSFYYFMIQHVICYGDFQAVVAVTKPNNGSIKFLFPENYVGDTGFKDLFINKKIAGDKRPICFAISDLFVKTERRNLDCCDLEMKNLVHKNIWSKDTIMIITAYTEHCCNGFYKTKKSEMKDYVSVKTTKFWFNHDTLKSIIFDDMWQK